MTDIAIKIENLSKVYQNNPHALTVFDDFSISFDKGKITALTGPSGSGKSTLLRMVAGLETVTKGHIYLKGKTKRIGMIFQDKALFPWLTVEGNIQFCLELSGFQKEMRQKIGKFWLEKVNLYKFKNYYPSQLSGGMKQRLAFARCMAIDPDIVLMDEPFASQDYETKYELIKLLEKLFLEIKFTSIFVTHNIDDALLLSDRIVSISHSGKINTDEKLEGSRPRNFRR